MKAYRYEAGRKIQIQRSFTGDSGELRDVGNSIRVCKTHIEDGNRQTPFHVSLFAVLVTHRHHRLRFAGVERLGGAPL